MVCLAGYAISASLKLLAGPPGLWDPSMCCNMLVLHVKKHVVTIKLGYFTCEDHLFSHVWYLLLALCNTSLPPIVLLYHPHFEG